jgi:hypothetical protein
MEVVRSIPQKYHRNKIYYVWIWNCYSEDYEFLPVYMPLRQRRQYYEHITFRRVSSSGIWRLVVRRVVPDVSEERIASIFGVEE